MTWLQERYSIAFYFAQLRMFHHDCAGAISFRISSTYQHVQRADNFTGFGYLPDFTPAHHELLLIGIIGGIPFLLSPRICHNLSSPLSGRMYFVTCGSLSISTLLFSKLLWHFATV